MLHHGYVDRCFTAETKRYSYWYALFANFCGVNIPITADFKLLPWCQWTLRWEEMAPSALVSPYKPAPLHHWLQNRHRKYPPDLWLQNVCAGKFKFKETCLRKISRWLFIFTTFVKREDGEITCISVKIASLHTNGEV